MINFIVLDVILTSVLTSGIVAIVVFLLLSHKYNETYKKRLDEIMHKINNQSSSFSYQVNGLKKNLKDIVKILETIKKKKSSK